MGTEQYHEPPSELPADTRTFAGLCACLREEAEAIGWYAQRMARVILFTDGGIVQHGEASEAEATGG